VRAGVSAVIETSGTPEVMPVIFSWNKLWFCFLHSRWNTREPDWVTCVLSCLDMRISGGKWGWPLAISLVYMLHLSLCILSCNYSSGINLFYHYFIFIFIIRLLLYYYYHYYYYYVLYFFHEVLLCSQDGSDVLRCVIESGGSCIREPRTSYNWLHSRATPKYGGPFFCINLVARVGAVWLRRTMCSVSLVIYLHLYSTFLMHKTLSKIQK